MKRNECTHVGTRLHTRPAKPPSRQNSAKALAYFSMASSPSRSVETSKRESLGAIHNDLSVDELKQQFIANMNHELRTPLNGLMGAAELLSMTHLDAEQRHYLEIFHKANKQLHGLVENMLDFSHLLSSKAKTQKCRFDVWQITRDSYEHFLPFAERKHLTFTLTIDPDVPRWIVADPTRLTQILYHLLSNALKFTLRGGVGIHLAYDREALLLRVRDSGIGVPKSKQSRIFDPFYQVDQSHTRKFGGTGLGLAISRFLTNAMEGDLTMSSEPNRGSEFSIRFPFLSSPNLDADLNAAKEQNHPRILLVEDNEINQAIVYLLFSKRGITIDIAQDGLEGLNAHRRRPYDLIFMDLQMPVMDGIEATRQIRTFDKDVSIIALTADLCPEDKTRGLAAGMDEFLTKPLNPLGVQTLLDRARNRVTT